jgi:HK97 family phage portal protein
MRLLGFEISRTKAAVGPTQLVPAMIGPSGGWSGWLSSWSSVISESFAGAWQRNITVESSENILKFSAVYACVSLISDDISKLRIKVIEDDDEDGIWIETHRSAFSPVLRKPNRYQTCIQFLSQWIACKLLNGNVYVLKERDARNVVIAMYVLDPSRVTPLVAEDGSVFYKLKTDFLAGVDDNELAVPASEIIHDRMVTLWHPLVGVSPIYACGASATQGIRIQNNSGKFFENMSRPSGILTAPGQISDELALRLKTHWETNYVGSAIGKVAVLGDGLKYEAMTIPAAEAQLIEQLRWTVEDVARCFHVPLHKLGMGQPTLNNIAALNQDYYTQCLQSLIEALELLLDEGLALPTTIGVELDLDGLLRMDPLSLADANEKGVRAGVLTPNEARFRLNLPPIEGGDSAYLQQQNFSLEALAKRDAQADPFSTSKPEPAPAPALPAPAAKPDQAQALADALIKRFRGAVHV